MKKVLEVAGKKIFITPRGCVVDVAGHRVSEADYLFAKPYFGEDTKVLAKQWRQFRGKLWRVTFFLLGAGVVVLAEQLLRH